MYRPEVTLCLQHKDSVLNTYPVFHSDPILNAFMGAVITCKDKQYRLAHKGYKADPNRTIVFFHLDPIVMDD